MKASAEHSTPNPVPPSKVSTIVVALHLASKIALIASRFYAFTEAYDIIMSRSLSRVLGTIWAPSLSISHTVHRGSNRLNDLLSTKVTNTAIIPVARYSKRNGPPSDAGGYFKTVKSRDLDDDDELNSLESEPNWELTAERGNRFYLPNGIGPAWQGDSTTVGLLEPLGHLVNFHKGPNTDKSRLEFTCCKCPLLIRVPLLEIFPVPVVAQQCINITMLVLSHEGDIEMGAAKVRNQFYSRIHTVAGNHTAVYLDEFEE